MDTEAHMALLSNVAGLNLYWLIAATASRSTAGPADCAIAIHNCFSGFRAK
jgi:hypothetical protein